MVGAKVRFVARMLFCISVTGILEVATTSNCTLIAEYNGLW